jgi:hypothetical protein
VKRGALAFAALLALTGCGGGSDSGSPPARRANATSPGPATLSGPDLERRVFNALRARLRELSITAGASGETGDIGQAVPTGLVNSVACRPAGGGSASFRCAVRWSDQRGRARVTRYDVRPSAEDCFTASARPALPAIYDRTLDTYATNPLQDPSGAGQRC